MITNFEYQAEGYQTYKVPGDGIYTLTAYGSSGGDFGKYKGGAGTKVTGTFHLKKGDTLYVFTGGQGTNGGGSGSAEGAPGGGATDIRLNGTDISDRILVAAGGAGANKGKNGEAEEAGQKSNDILYQGTNAAEDITPPAITPQIPMNVPPEQYRIDVSGGGGGYYGGAAGYKKASADQKRISQVDYNSLPDTIQEMSIHKAAYVTPKYLTSAPITVSSLSIPDSIYTNGGIGPRVLPGKQVWLYKIESVTVNGTDYYRYAFDGDAGFTLNGIHYDSDVGILVSNVKQDKVLVSLAEAPSGADGYHIRNHPWPMSPAPNGDFNAGIISTIKVQTYEWKSPSYRTGMAGISYVDNNIGTTEETVYGNNTGNGHATITVYDFSAGEQDGTEQNGVVAIDYATPDAPYGGRILSSDGSNAVLTWLKPDDNGTPYWNKAESYYADTLEKINDSNITMTDVETGVEKYRWYADYNEEGTVTGTNSVESTINQIETPSENLTMYYHIAAIDYAGNIGPTYTFNPIEGIDIEVTINWEDYQNEKGTRPADGVSITIYELHENEEGTVEKIPVNTKSLESYGNSEKLLFEHLPSVDENGNVIKYIAQIDGVKSDNNYYDYITSYSDDTFTITNEIKEINRVIHIEVEWDDNDNILDTRPDNFVIEIIDKDGNVVKTFKADAADANIDIPVSLGEDFTINVTGIDSKHSENSYTTTIMLTGDDKFKVVSILDYQFTVKPNGGVWEGRKDNQTFSLEADGSMEISAPVRTGYKFVEWEISGDAKITDDVITIGKENVTITAKWEKIPYVLTIDPNSGTFESFNMIQKFTMYYGDKRIIPVPYRPGYEFIGWTTNGTGMIMSSLTEKALFTMGVSDVLLRANWAPKKITVTLDPKGGTVEKEQIEVTYGSPYSEIPVPEKPGCEFITWSLDSDGKYPIDADSIVNIDKEHILYAQYMPKTISINGRVEWIDENNKFHSRPNELTVNILSDGKFMIWLGETESDGTSVKTTSTDWTFSKEMLQEYNLLTNKPIEYGVILSPAPAESANIQYAYKTEYSVDQDGTFVITNTLYEAKVALKGTITWVDKNNVWGSRPDNTDIILYADGVEVQKITVSKEDIQGNNDVWNFAFEKMNIYNKDGSEIKYTVKVNPDPTPSNNIDDIYKVSYDGLNITETLVNANKVVKGTITWDDEEDKYHYRPDNSIIILYNTVNGIKMEIARLEVTSVQKEFSFNNLPKYDNGYNLIKYSIEEIISPAYSVVIEEKEIENTNGIVDNTEFDVINTFTPNQEVKPDTIADVCMKVTYENEELFSSIGFNKKGTTFPVRLIEMEKIFTGKDEKYEISYGGKTDKEYKVVLTDEYIKIDNLWPGKYLIDIEVRPQFGMIGMNSSLEDGAEIVYENGKWYLIISPEAEGSSIHIDAIMKPNWRGYCDRQSAYNYFNV